MGLFELLKRLIGQAGPRAAPLPPPEQGHGVEELARRLGMTAEDLLRLEVRYHTFQIPKRRGGMRTITAPAPSLKAVQRRIHQRLLKRLHAHPAAMGFTLGESIATHALGHAARAVVVKMDLRDFFPSITAQRVHRYFRWIGWNEQAAQILLRLTTHEGSLPQGAPTSPRLSNLVNYPLDARLSTLAGAVPLYAPLNPKTLEPVTRRTPAGEVYYSRYADDLTFSFSLDDHQTIQAVIWHAKAIVEDEGYKLHTRKKLRIMRRHDRQTVTGLVVNAGVRLPRSTRRWLRAVEHHRATGRPTTLSEQQLDGWRALQQMVDSAWAGGS